jgi:hypothetical protein
MNHSELGNTNSVDPLDLTLPDTGSQFNTPRQMEFGLRLNF